MTTNEILNLDYNVMSNRELIQKAMTKIKPLSKYSDEFVPLIEIERAINMITKKYLIRPQFIMMTFGEKKCVYSCGVKTDDKHKWLGDVYGCEIYELMAKLLIKMYAEVKSGKIEKRSEKIL